LLTYPLLARCIPDFQLHLMLNHSPLGLYENN
jgi:hypothetical protein